MDVDTSETVQPGPVSKPSKNSVEDGEEATVQEKPVLAPPMTASATLPDDLQALREQAFGLASEIADHMGAGGIIKSLDAGYGFLVGPLPDGGRCLTNAYSGKGDARMVVLALWWMLATISEQFELLGNAIPHIPPEWADREIGEAMRQAEQFHLWQINNLKSQEVPYIPIPHIGSFGFNMLHDPSWESWVDLVNITRRIFKLSGGWDRASRHGQERV